MTRLIRACFFAPSVVFISRLLFGLAFGALPRLSSSAAAAEPAPNPDEAPYLKQIHERIHPRWSGFLVELKRSAGVPYQDPALRTELIFAVERSGAVSRIQIARRAGLKGFDDAPIDLLHELTPLSPPPPSLASDDGRTYVSWKFQREEPGCEVFAVVDRRLPLREAVPSLVAQGKTAAALARLHDQGAAQGATNIDDALLSSFARALGRRAAQTPSTPAERAAAAAVLAQMPDGEAALLALLADPEVAVRRAALSALSGRRLTAAAAAPLRLLLSGEERAQAALLLHRLGDDSGTSALRGALAAGKGAAAAAAALKQLGDQAEAARLTGLLLADPAQQTAGIAAARELGDPALGDALLALLSASAQEKSPEKSPPSAGASGAAPGAASAPSPPTASERRRDILGAFAAMGERAPAAARKLLLRALGDADDPVRALAMAASPQLGDRSLAVRYRLIDGLADKSQAVRMAAAGALVEVGGEAARDEVLQAARNRDPAVRAAVYLALRNHPLKDFGKFIAHLGADPAIARILRGPLPAYEPDRAALMQRLLDPAADPVSRLHAAAAWLVPPDIHDPHEAVAAPQTPPPPASAPPGRPPERHDSAAPAGKRTAGAPGPSAL